MGPGYYIIAILGCADGSTTCAPAATVPTRYESQAACSAGIPLALQKNSDLDFPTLVAECRAVKSPAAAEHKRAVAIPAAARRG